MPSAKVADGNCRRITAAVQCKKNEEKEKKREEQIFKCLAERREVLEDQLLSKLEKLKAICIQEGELTGELPPEIYKTLMPGEMEPRVKRRVGTTFKFSQQVLTRPQQGDSSTNDNNEEVITIQLEADIELHRKIVAAAERLAKDKNMNKSVRKKRRKDWQAASQRLKGLEKGLHKLRISSSKPDVSTNFDTVSCGNVGSGFSLNSLKGWPNISGHSLKSPAKSCPSTPHGSIHDLSTSELVILQTDKCSDHPSTSANVRSTTTLYMDDAADGCLGKRSPKAKLFSTLSPRPSISTSTSKVVAQGGMSSSSFSDAKLPPVVPNRRPHATTNASNTSLNRTHNGNDSANDSRSPYYEPPLYANIGYASAVPYKSAYRQSNFPTFQDTRNGNVLVKPALSTRFSVEKSSDANSGYVIEYPPSVAHGSSNSARHDVADSSMIEVEALTSQFAKFTRHISATTITSTSLSSSTASSSASSVMQTISGQHQSQRCSTSSQSSSISIGSISSTSSSSGYNSLVNALSTQQLFVGAPQSTRTADGFEGFPVAVPRLTSLKHMSGYSYPNSTTSLDRRAMRSGFSSSSLLAASVYDNYHQNGLETRFQTQNNLLTTTFPVNDHCRPLELSDFSKFRSNSAVTSRPVLAASATMKRASVSVREFPRFHFVTSSTPNAWNHTNTAPFQSCKPIRE